MARYRLNYGDVRIGRQKLTGKPKLVEIVVHPSWRLTEELALALVVTADWVKW